MYRSVTPSRQEHSKARKTLFWAEGVLVGVVVFLGMFYVLGWLTL
ncbi:MAG: hypothetical protein ACE5KF_11950 [Kiloniellaceae bacterium]